MAAIGDKFRWSGSGNIYVLIGHCGKKFILKNLTYNRTYNFNCLPNKTCILSGGKQC